MADSLFSIQCVTCQATLKVRDRKIIGQILSCPKCESMVQVIPPDGWRDPTEKQANPAPANPKQQTPAKNTTPQTAKPNHPDKQQKPSQRVANQSASKTPPKTKYQEPTGGIDLSTLSSKETLSPKNSEQDRPQQAFTPPPLPPLPPSPGSPPINPTTSEFHLSSEELLAQHDRIATTQPPQNWVSPTEKMASTWIKYAASAAVGVIITVIVFNLFRSYDSNQPPSTELIDGNNVDNANKNPKNSENNRDNHSSNTTGNKTTGPVDPPKPKNTDNHSTTQNNQKPTDNPPPTKKTNTSDPENKKPNKPVVPPEKKQPLPTIALITEKIFGDLKTLPQFQEIAAADINNELITKNTSPDLVDVPSNMKKEIGDIKFENTPLHDVLATLQSLSAIPIALNIDTLQFFKISAAKKISLQLRKATPTAVLEQLVSQLNLEYQMDEDHVWITVKRKTRLQQHHREYQIGDLFDHDQNAINQFATIIKSWIAPQSWKSKNNKAVGTLQIVDGRLKVSQTLEAHSHINRLIERFQWAKNRTDVKENFSVGLKTRTHQAEKATSKKLTLYYSIPTELTKIVKTVQRETGTTILFDWQNLTLERVYLNSKIRLSAKNLSLAETLSQMLQPLGLTFRVINEQTILITSIDAAKDHYELEVYAIAEILKSGVKPMELQDALTYLVGKDNLNTSSMYYEPKTECLCILQTQHQHAHIQRLLDIAHTHRQKLSATATKTTAMKIIVPEKVRIQ